MHTGTPCDVVWVDLVQDARCLLLAIDVFNASDKDAEPTWQSSAELFDGGHLFLFADYAGDGPGALEEQWGEELGDFAVAAEDEDVVW